MPIGIIDNLQTYRREKTRRRLTSQCTAARNMKRGVQKPTHSKPTKSAAKKQSQNGGKSKKLKKSKKTKSRKRLTRKHKPRHFHFMSL